MGVINLESIISVKALAPTDHDGVYFPFTVVFSGKGSPWNLRAFSEVSLALEIVTNQQKLQ